MSNLGNNENNAKAKLLNYNLTIRDLKKTENIKGKQWPFVVVRNERSSSEMIIRGFSDLEKSIVDTECALSKAGMTPLYETIISKFRKLSPEIKNSITSIIFTSERVIYVVDDADKKTATIGSFKIREKTIGKSNEISKFEAEVLSLFYNEIVRSQKIDNNLKNLFDNYSKVDEYSKKIIISDLKIFIREYIKTHKKRNDYTSELDYSAVLKNESFPALKYVTFISDSKEDSIIVSNIITKEIELIKENMIKEVAKTGQVNLDEYVSQYLNSLSQHMNILGKLNIYGRQTLKSNLETDIIKKIKEKTIEYNKGIRKIYVLPSSYLKELNSADGVFRDISKDDNYFKVIARDENNYDGYRVFISEHEQKRAEDNKVIEEKEKQRLKELFEDYLTKINNKYASCLDIMTKIEFILSVSEYVKNSINSLNPAEYKIWGSSLSYENLKKRIEDEFLYMRNYNNASSKEYTVSMDFSLNEVFKTYYNYMIANGLKTEDEVNNEYKKVLISKYILPVGISDDRKTENSMTIGFKTEEECKNLLNNLDKIFNIFVIIERTILGIILGIYGKNMARFGKNIDVAVMLRKELKSKYSPGTIYCTQPILETANRIFYLESVLGSKLDETYSVENRKSSLSKLNLLDNTVELYLSKLSSEPINKLSLKTIVQSDSAISSEKEKEYSNLNFVFNFICDILNDCCLTAKVDMNEESIISNLHNKLNIANISIK